MHTTHATASHLSLFVPACTQRTPQHLTSAFSSWSHVQLRTNLGAMCTRAKRPVHSPPDSPPSTVLGDHATHTQGCWPSSRRCVAGSLWCWWHKLRHVMVENKAHDARYANIWYGWRGVKPAFPPPSTTPCHAVRKPPQVSVLVDCTGHTVRKQSGLL